MTGKEPMSSREQCDQLLETIDAVLLECGKDPRRRGTVRPQSRPTWRGPSWLQEPLRAEVKGLAEEADRLRS